jgi:hypothetical protein
MNKIEAIAIIHSLPERAYIGPLSVTVVPVSAPDEPAPPPPPAPEPAPQEETRWVRVTEEVNALTISGDNEKGKLILGPAGSPGNRLTFLPGDEVAVLTDKLKRYEVNGGLACWELAWVEKPPSMKDVRLFLPGDKTIKL